VAVDVQRGESSKKGPQWADAFLCQAPAAVPSGTPIVRVVKMRLLPGWVVDVQESAVTVAKNKTPHECRCGGAAFYKRENSSRS
jgi:hypothetical protein